MLKADLHIHSGEDTSDDFIDYSYTDVIDKASKNNIDVLSFTFHDQYWYEDALDYANEKGILLIPGIEKEIEGKHVLLYNFTKEELDEITHFEDLRRVKKNKHLVVAPHPFFKTSNCLGGLLKRYRDVFDAVEISYLHSKYINFNKKAVRLAKKNKIPMIATSDLHFINMFGRYFTCIDSKKDINSVIKSIKNNRVKLYSPHLKTKYVLGRAFKHVWWKNVCNRNRIDSSHIWSGYNQG